MTAIELTGEQRKYLLEDPTAAIPVTTDGEVVAYLVYGMRMQTDPVFVHAIKNNLTGVKEPTKSAAEVRAEMRRRFFSDADPDGR